MWGKMSYSWPIGIQTAETTLEISLEFSQKINNKKYHMI